MKKEIISPITITQLEDHFKELLTGGRPEFLEKTADGNDEAQPLDVQLDEVVSAIKELKNGKAPGAGGIPSELIKCGTGKLPECLRELFGSLHKR